MAYVNVAQLIDRSRLHSAQVLVLVLCGLCMVMDGFDVQAMGYVAPAIINEWHVAKPALGPIFGAGLFGIMLGFLGLSIVADKIGRRPVLIGAMTFLAISMIAAAQATTLDYLWATAELFHAAAVPAGIAVVAMIGFWRVARLQSPGAVANLVPAEIPS